MKKAKSVTKRTYKKWKITRYSLKASTYLLPLVPEGIILGINWNEWFATKESWSIGLGFGSLLVTVLVTILGIAKRDEFINKNVSSLFYLSGLMAMWAVVLMFLASIANQFGIMLLYTSAGICAGATCDQVNKAVVIPEVEWYKEMLKDVGLDQKEEKRKAIREKARQEAIKEKEAIDDGTMV